MKNDGIKPSESLLVLMDALLGSVEEMSSEELSSTLAEAGVDADAARRRLVESVRANHSRLFERDAPVPADISSLLAQLDPGDAGSPESASTKRARSNWLRDLVERRLASGEVALAAKANEPTGSQDDKDPDRSGEGTNRRRPRKRGEDAE